MIKRIFPNEADQFNMSLRRTVASAPKQKIDYKGMVVDKPWGYEYLMFENKQVAIWVLFLKNNAKTSVHCHPKKKTSLLVLDGLVETSTLDSLFRLEKMNGVIIERGAFHSTASFAPQGSFVMEIETPVEKSDLVRLKDEYGRENLGYESGESISMETSNYHYCDFHNENEERKEVVKLIRDVPIKVCYHNDFDELYAEFSKHAEKIMCPLNYKLVTSEGKVNIEVGDILKVKNLSAQQIAHIEDGKNLVSLIIG